MAIVAQKREKRKIAVRDFLTRKDIKVRFFMFLKILSIFLYWE